MKKILLKTMLLLCAFVVGSSAWGQSDVYTSNVTLSASGGTNASSAKVRMSSSGTQYDAIKLGTSSKSGSAYITVPAGTTVLHVHCAGWNGDGNSRKLNLTTTAQGVTISPVSMSLTNDSGISSNSPFTLSTSANASTSYYASFSLSGVTSNTQIKLETSAKRAVYWGVNVEVGITSISFSAPKTANVGVGGSVTLTPTILPATYTEAIDWVSDNTSVATVSSTGVVTGVAEGTAHITAKSHGNPTTIYDVCEVTVAAAKPVTGVSLKSETTLLLGGTETLTPSFTPADATNQNVTWESSDSEKVSVENGVITGLALTNGTPVTITVTTEDGDFTATCDVTVNPVPVSSVSLNNTSATIRVNKTLQLAATISPDNATDQTVSWESNNTGVATVSNTGLVTAKAVGTATITAKSNDDNTKFATCVVTVIDGAIELAVGDVLIFNNFSGAGGSYDSGKDKNTDFTADNDIEYNWSGNNYMSNQGLQLKASVGTITSPVVKAPNGYKLEITSDRNINVFVGSEQQTPVATKTWKLANNQAFTINNAVSSATTVTKVTITALKPSRTITFTETGGQSILVGETLNNAATASPAGTVTYSSSNTEVATVDENTGVVTGVKRGTAVITATVAEDSDYEMSSNNYTVTVSNPSHDVAFYDKGTHLTTYDASVEEEEEITFPDDPSAKGYIFLGWATAPIEGTAAVKPTTTYGSNVAMGTENVSYYAVYGKIGEDEFTATFKASDTSNLTQDGSNLWWDENNTNVSLYISNGQLYAGSSTNPAAFNVTKNSGTSKDNYFYVEAPGAIQSIEITITGGSYNVASVAYGSLSTSGITQTITYDGVETDFEYCYANTSQQVRATEIKVTAKEYVNYCTSMTEPITISAAKYATYVTKNAVSFENTDVKAYVVTEETETSIKLAEVTEAPASTPLIVYAENANTYQVPCVASAADPTTNLLDYSPIAFEATGSEYCLAKKNDVVGFYPVTTGVTIPAYKAYLVSSNPVKAFAFDFDDEATGINEVEGAKNNVEGAYDLMGRKVAQPTRGLYIVNGKKVFINK